MSGRDLESVLTAVEFAASPAAAPNAKTGGLVIGQIVGFKDNGATPLVIYSDQRGTAAIAARAIVDLHGEHIGLDVAMMFENGDPLRPIVIGCLRSERTWQVPEQPDQVEVDSDGQRLVVTAKDQIVLRCGKASITLTKTGKVLIQGTYVSTRSTGVNRVKGASVQIN